MPSRASGTGLSPSMIGLSRTFFSQSKYDCVVLQPRQRVTTPTVWAVPRSLATTGGIIKLFSLPRGTKMFQFPRFASLPKKIAMTVLQTAGLSHSEIRGSKGIAPPRSLSQLITSFIASVSIGIHHAPLSCFLRQTNPMHQRYNGKVRSYFQLSRQHTVMNYHHTAVRKFLFKTCLLHSLACFNMSKIGYKIRGL